MDLTMEITNANVAEGILCLRPTTKWWWTGGTLANAFEQICDEWKWTDARAQSEQMPFHSKNHDWRGVVQSPITPLAPTLGVNQASIRRILILVTAVACLMMMNVRLYVIYGHVLVSTAANAVAKHWLICLLSCAALFWAQWMALYMCFVSGCGNCWCLCTDTKPHNYIKHHSMLFHKCWQTCSNFAAEHHQHHLSVSTCGCVYVCDACGGHCHSCSNCNISILISSKGNCQCGKHTEYFPCLPPIRRVEEIFCSWRRQCC